MRCVLCPAPGIFFKHIFLHLLIIYYQLNYDDNKVKDEGIELWETGRGSRLEPLVSYIIYLFLIIKFHLQVNYDDYVYGHHQHREQQQLSTPATTTTTTTTTLGNISAATFYLVPLRV